MTRAGLTTVHVRGFRSLRDASFRPEAIAAIVGEPSTGKSNLLSAIWALLDPAAAPLVPPTCPRTAAARSGSSASSRTAGRSPSRSSAGGRDGGAEAETTTDGGRPPVVFLPAALRGGELLAAPGPAGNPGPIQALFREAAARVEAETDRRRSTPWSRGSRRGVTRATAARSC